MALRAKHYSSNKSCESLTLSFVVLSFLLQLRSSFILGKSLTLSFVVLSFLLQLRLRYILGLVFLSSLLAEPIDDDTQLVTLAYMPILLPFLFRAYKLKALHCTCPVFLANH